MTDQASKFEMCHFRDAMTLSFEEEGQSPKGGCKCMHAIIASARLNRSKELTKQIHYNN